MTETCKSPAEKVWHQDHVMTCYLFPNLDHKKSIFAPISGNVRRGLGYISRSTVAIGYSKDYIMKLANQETQYEMRYCFHG